MDRIGIIGAGAWGTALAVVAREAGREVVLWTRRDSLARSIAETGRNPDYLKDVALGPAIAATADPAEAADGTIRKDFAESIEANSVHGSDAPETAVQESSFFFSADEIVG